MASTNLKSALFMLLSPIIKVSQNNATRMTARAVVSLLCQTWRQKEVSSSPEQAAQHEWYRILSDAYHHTLGVRNNILSLRGAPRQSNPFPESPRPPSGRPRNDSYTSSAGGIIGSGSGLMGSSV